MASQADELKSFFGNGLFDWQFSNATEEQLWHERQYNPDKYWGGFSKESNDSEKEDLPEWAIGPFEKWQGNPVFRPSEAGWDRGHFGGGVHNGSILRKDGRFYYIYRGERELPVEGFDMERGNGFDYVCDIGIAVSDNGYDFVRDETHSPFFGRGEDAQCSFEDVNVVKRGDTYYLFCNRWDWRKPTDPSVSGVFLATSKDLYHWEKVGLLFSDATAIHRNPAVLQNPQNEAVSVNGKFIMYLNNGLIAYSEDLLHWESREVPTLWPGGEGCFAVADYGDRQDDNIVLFTGGHHTGHFYAIGEVLFSKSDPEKPLEWLSRPVLRADSGIPWEAGLAEEQPHPPVSHWRDTIFFTGMTRHEGKWYMYYGGSEYYTCLAVVEAVVRP